MTWCVLPGRSRLGVFGCRPDGSRERKTQAIILHFVQPSTTGLARNSTRPLRNPSAGQSRHARVPTDESRQHKGSGVDQSVSLPAWHLRDGAGARSRYGLVECPEPSYPARRRRNVAALRSGDQTSAGSEGLTKDCRDLGKPWLGRHFTVPVIAGNRGSGAVPLGSLPADRGRGLVIVQSARPWPSCAMPRQSDRSALGQRAATA